MDSSLPLHIKKFNDKLRAMNQANAKILTLNAEEACSLHAEIYDLMAKIASLSVATDSNAAVEIRMDGGGFK
jgi:pentose-5-phosphate-3-epimerase